MNFVLTGVNHKSAPLEVRERLAISPSRLEEATQSLLGVPGVREAMILSTCNRVEFLTWQEPANADLLRFMQNYFAVDVGALRPYLYEYRASEVVRHVFRVASSLDSLVVGEPQILGQVKESYTVARSVGGVNANLEPLLQRAFSVARKVRNQTNIGVSSVSIASVAVDLARKIFGSLHGKTVLLMGAGKMGELAARSLMHQGASQIFLCNRTDERARALAEKFSLHASAWCGANSANDCERIPTVQAISYQSLHGHAAAADIVVSSTGSETPIFLTEHAHMYAQRRKQRPMFFIDIAVPRDVDPAIQNVEGIFVYNIDDLQAVAAENLSNRAREAQDAEAIIRNEVNRYTQRMQSADPVPAILALRESMEEVRQQELRRIAPRLRSLSNEQMQAVEQVTRALVNKMQHGPIQEIKRAAREGDRETLAAVQHSFDRERHARDLAEALHVKVMDAPQGSDHQAAETDATSTADGSASPSDLPTDPKEDCRR
jgi:glutamyl-tRNA reductase